MWLIKVFSAICFFAVCAAQDSHTVSVDISTATVLTPLVSTTTYVPPAPFLQLQTKWPDVFLSEKAVFKCNITGGSDWTFTWFQTGKEVQDSDPNFSFSEGGSVLTITAATQTYAGIYTCKVHHKTRGGATESRNSHELKVYPNKPKPTVSRTSNFDTMFPGESITFECTVAISSGWDFLWYHNGEEIQQPSSSYTIERVDHDKSGEYHCRAKRGKDPFYTEDSIKATLQISDPPTPHLRLLSPWPDVFENETLQFVCDVNSPMWNFFWYKDQVDLKDTIEEEEQFMNITFVTQTTQGGYACKVNLESRNVTSGFSNTVDITVYDSIPKPTLSKDPTLNSMYVGENVTFTCNVGVSWGWEYQWFKDGREIPKTNETISIHLSSADKGKYSCMAFRGETLTADSEGIAQDVLEIPVPSLKQLTQWSDVFPAETVEMKCEMNDSSDWTFTWYKDGQMIRADDVVSFDSNEASLSINSASAAHAGTYHCMGHLNKRSVSSSNSSEHILTVYEKNPTVTLKQDPDYKVMFPGESFSFSCHASVSIGWEYVWFKDNKKLGVSGKILKAEDQGSYKCKLQRSTYQVPVYSQALYLTVKVKSPKPVVTQQPDVGKVYTSELVSLTCTVEGSTGWKYFWEKDGTRLLNNSDSFNIFNVSSLDSGTYKCKALRDKTKLWTEPSDGQILNIFEIPVPSLKRLTPWLAVFPNESVIWSCRMDDDPDWTYTWYKDGQRVQTDEATFNSDASTYAIIYASPLHRGSYTCSAKLKGRSVNSKHSPQETLHVYDKKPSITMMQNPDHNVMHTGDEVSFGCHINVSSGWEFLWYKDGRPLKEFRNHHTILSVSTKDSGSYTCLSKRGNKTVFYSDQSQAVRLNIHERPKPDVVLLTGWSEVFSTDSLVLECRVQGDHPWNYTWYRDSQQIALVDIQSKRYTVTPQNDPEQSQYSCKGISNKRPSYSEMSNQFMTKNLLLKRRLLLSISGIIFFGIILTLIGCISLRIRRKPAKDEYKPEEADLFVRMTQLKDSDDAVSPVEYVGQDAFSKPEGDENGTICSETTPLPITLQGDQELTTESNNATESNGGLISFKQ